MGSCQCMGGTREASCLDGEDNDCDMLVDCMDDDCIGASRPCMGMCGEGAESCEGSGVWGVCEGGNGEMEICGGLRGRQVGGRRRVGNNGELVVFLGLFLAV